MRRYVLTGGVAALLFVAANADAGEIVKGPWLQNVTPDGVTVMWEDGALEPDAPSVDYGRTEACEMGSVAATHADVNGYHVYSARIEGLDPSTQYHYRVTSGATSTPAVTLRTAPEPGTTGFRYYVTGDSRSNPGVWGAITSMILADMQEYPPYNQTLVVNTGDVAADGSEYDDWDQLWPPARATLGVMPLYVALGNHEDQTTEESDAFIYGYFDFPYVESGSTDEKWFSLDHGGVHMTFVAIFAEEGYVSGPQHDWLIADLEAARTDPGVAWTFAFIHFTPWSLGNHGESDAVDLRAHLHPAFSIVPVDAVFGGHNHLYARYAPIDGVTYITEGGGGASLHEDLYTEWEGGTLMYAEGVHSYMTVDVERDVVAMRALDLEGMLMDWVTLGGTDADRPPLADAGPSSVTYVGNAVTLDGSGSRDPEDASLAYQWTQVTGPAASLSALDIVNPSFDPDQAGTYVFALRVSDGTTTSAPDHVQIDVHAGMLTFAAVADTYVDEDEPDEGHGGSDTLYLDMGTTYSPTENQHIYLRFSPTGIGGAVSGATLRLFCVNEGSEADVLTSSDVSWSEQSPTWGSPLPADGLLAGRLAPTSEESWVEADVTPAITGDGPVTLILRPVESNGADFHSRENLHPPELVVTWKDDAPDDPACTVTSDQYQVPNGIEVGFSSTSAAAPGASIVSREWDFDWSGFAFTVEATGETARTTFWGVGSTTVALRVTDDAGRTGICTTAVTVLPVDLIDDPPGGCSCSIAW